MTPLLRWPVVLVLVMLCGFGLRTFKALQIENFEHDDQISYLAANGTLDEYTRLTVQDSISPLIAPAAQWQALFHAPAAAPLQTVRDISQSLQQEDIHPPLYFVWLRAVISVLPQITPATGWFSNALFFLLNAGLLFGLGRRLLGTPQAAVLATAIWCCGVAAIETSIVARHYEIYALFTLASTLYLLWLQDNNRFSPLPLLLYGLLLAAGFLANYQFLYHIGALSLLILLADWRRPLRVLVFAAVTLLALAGALALYPALLQQSAEVAGWSGAATAQEFLFRLKNTVEEVLKFCVIGSLALVLARQRKVLAGLDRRLWTLLGINLLGVAGVYLAFIAPRHAMGDRYLAAVWPFLSLLLAAALFSGWQHRSFRIIASLLILLPALMFLKKPFKHPAPPDAIHAVPLVIADFDERGVWPSLLLHLDPQQATVVGTQDSLLAHPEWIGQVVQAGSALYCSAAALDGNSAAKQQQMLDLLGRQLTVEQVPSKNRGIRFYRLTARPAN